MFYVPGVTNHLCTNELDLTAVVQESSVTAVGSCIVNSRRRKAAIGTGCEKGTMLVLVLVEINGEKITLRGEAESLSPTIAKCVLTHMGQGVSTAAGSLRQRKICHVSQRTTGMGTEGIMFLRILPLCVSLATKISNTLLRETQRVDIAELKLRNKAGKPYKQGNPRSKAASNIAVRRNA